MDDLKIYPFALTANEVKLDYNRGQAVKLGVLGTSITDGKTASDSAATAYCIPGDTTSCTPPIGEWNFEEGSSTAVNDTSGNANTGTWNGTGTTHWTAGKIGKAGKFNGSDDYVDVGNASSLDVGISQYTISMWIYRNSDSGGYERLLSKTNSAGAGVVDWSYFLQITSADIVNTGCGISTSNDGWLDGTTTISTGRWYHVAGVKTSTQFELYINGKLDASGLTGGTFSNCQDNDWSTYIGRLGSGGTYYYGFSGLIDQVKLYNYARTPAQIAYDYNRGLPLAHWKLDECQGTTLNDSSGNNFTGTLTIGASGGNDAVGTCTTVDTTTAWYNGRNGKMNYSLYFDKTDDYISVPDNNSLDFTGPFSISLWLYIPTGSNNTETEVIIKGTADDCQNYSITLDASQNICAISSNSCGFDPGVQCDRSGAISLDTWHYIAISFDGTNMSFYKEGRRSDRFPWTIGSTNTGDLAIAGASGQPSSDFFGGQLDDVKVFNYALTDAQVKTDYNQSSAVRFAPISGAP